MTVQLHDKPDNSKTFERTSDGVREIWNVWYLRKEAEGLEVFDLPLAYIDLDVSTWGDEARTTYGFACHMRRVLDTDLQHPVIMSHRGFVMDGWHRVVKAIVEGKETIKAVKFDQDPPPQERENL